MANLCPRSRRWWTHGLQTMRSKSKKLGRISYQHRDNQHHPIHQRYRRARNDYSEAIKKTKKEHLMDWLEEANAQSIWTMNSMVSGLPTDGGKARIPTLRIRANNGTIKELTNNEEKATALFKSFFRPKSTPNPVSPDHVYPDECEPLRPITNSQILRQAHWLHPFKAPGPNGIPNCVYKYCMDLLIPFLGPIYRATFTLQTYPAQWKIYTTVVLRKPQKPDYSELKAYRPIALLSTVAKILSACVAEDLSYMVETHQLLPPKHFRGRAGRTATDALHLMDKFVKDAWRRGKFVAGLSLYARQAYPSVAIDVLIHDMRSRRVPKMLTDWIVRKMEGRSTVLSFDDYMAESPIEIESGLNQGCTIAQLLYLFYNTDLIENGNTYLGELGLGFIDNVTLLAEANSPEEGAARVSEMMTRDQGALAWARAHGTDYNVDKFGWLGLSWLKKKDTTTGKFNPIARPNLHFEGHTITPKSSHKFLGVLVDQELRYREHANYALAKGTKWVSQIRRLATTTRGLSSRYARRLYLAVAVPRILYAVDC